MAQNPAFTYSQSRVDRSGERSRFSVNVQSSEGFGGSESAEQVAFKAAIESVCNGALVSESLTDVNKVSNVVNAATGQREEKWLVSYEDTVTLALYQTELPCRDTAIQPPVNTDEVDLTAAPWVAFTTAWEAYVLSPDGNPTNLTSVRLIGRNI